MATSQKQAAASKNAIKDLMAGIRRFTPEWFEKALDEATQARKDGNYLKAHNIGALALAELNQINFGTSNTALAEKFAAYFTHGENLKLLLDGKQISGTEVYHDLGKSYIKAGYNL